MLEIEECLERMLSEIEPQKLTEVVSILDCVDRVLAQSVVADKMVPPFPKSAMDGYAVKAEDIADAAKEKPVVLRVAGELLAGDYAEIPYEKNTAIRVMTGSYIPEGFDAVIRQEDTDYGQETVQIYAAVPAFANYCKVGEDIKKGDVVIRENTRLNAVHAGLLASIGVTEVEVYQPAKIAILSTGTELVEAGMPLTPGKIYNSIAYTLATAVKSQGLSIVAMETCADEETLLSEKIKHCLESADLLITTGAVSVGKKDVIPAVLEGLGAKELFRRANIQPGTPTMASALDGKVILSLSGNPYAAIANFEIYFWDIMAKMMHSATYRVRTEEAELSCEYQKTNKLRRLIRAYAEGGKVIIPTQIHASSVIQNLTECNCFIDLEAGRSVNVGDRVRVRYFKQ